MKWLRWNFVALLFILCLPAWRLLDWAVITFSYKEIFSVLMVLWGFAFVYLPFKLMLPRLKWRYSLVFSAIVGLLCWFNDTLTKSSTLDPELTHCSHASYAGFFHPIRPLLSAAFQDDLEVRNQLCWVRKMIHKVPKTLNKEELELRLDQLKVILLRPEFKYRITLPATLVLVGNYISAGIDENNELERAFSSKVFIDSLMFWTQHYTEEISQRSYAWYEWPHSSLIQAEYGFLEKNWEYIHLKFNQ